MKTTFHILLVVCFLSVYISSCTDLRPRVLDPVLSHAECIMYDHPDSALSLLESMSVPSDKYQNAVYSLLMVQARDKNYIKHTSDSLINVAYDYFIKKEDPNRRALVLNYEGRVNEDLGEIEKATEFYLRAADEVEKTKDYRLGYLINSNLGMIYAYRHFYEEGLLVFQKAYDLAEQSQDSICIAFSLINMGRIYSAAGQFNESILSYKQAVSISEQIKYRYRKSLGTALNELGGVYRIVGNSEKALLCTKRVKNEKLYNERTFSQVCLVLGDIYRSIGQYDSASFYLNQSLATNNIYTKRNAYQYLYLINKGKHSYKDAIEYNEKYLQCSDSVDQLNRSNIINEIQAKYNHEKLKNEKITLELEKNRLLKSSLLVLFLLLLVIALLVYIYQHRLLTKERTIQKDKEMLRQYTKQLRDNDLVIRRNQDRIKELSCEISNHTDLEESVKEQSVEISSLHKQNDNLLEENKHLQENINQFMQSLRQKDDELEEYRKLSEDNLRLRDREKFLCDQLMKQSAVLKQLRLSPKYIKTQGEWEEITEAINVLYDNYTTRLNEHYPLLTESDIQICILVKLHLNNSTIAVLTGISPASVTKRKQRMKERIGGDLPENESLDMWLQEF